MGYCALDKTRAVLTGEEIRGCWQAPAILEPADGLFGSLNTLLSPKRSASLAMAGPDGPSVGSLAGVLPRGFGGAGDPRGAAGSLGGDDPGSGRVPDRPNEVAEDGLRSRLARVTGRASRNPPAAVTAPVAARPRLEERHTAPIAAQTQSARPGRLVEAPLVRPSRRIVSAADRIVAEGFREASAPPMVPGSANLEMDGIPEDGPVG